MPTSAQAFFLLRTYVAESPLLPTSTTARPGACARHIISIRHCEVRLYGQWQSTLLCGSMLHDAVSVSSSLSVDIGLGEQDERAVLRQWEDLHKAGRRGMWLAFPYLDFMAAASTAISFLISSAVILPLMICAPPAAAGASACASPRMSHHNPCMHMSWP